MGIKKEEKHLKKRGKEEKEGKERKERVRKRKESTKMILTQEESSWCPSVIRQSGIYRDVLETDPP